MSKLSIQKPLTDEQIHNMQQEEFDKELKEVNQ